MKDELILVACPDDEVLNTVKMALATRDYGLLFAKDGQRAKHYLKLLRVDIRVAIISLELPKVSGLDLIWNLVKEKSPMRAKIIAISSSGVDGTPLLEKVVSEFGVDAVVRDPLDTQEWSATLEEVLDKPSSTGEHG